MTENAAGRYCDKLLITEDSLSAFLMKEEEKGLSEKMLRQIRGQIKAFFAWLPEEKCVTKEVLNLWRKSMAEHIKSVNKFVDNTSMRMSAHAERLAQAMKKPVPTALRSDNKSGCTGVFLRRGKWVAKISYQKKTYVLGSFADFEEAVNARKAAEELLEERLLWERPET